jgi:HAD superfamily hydrolase (TIGR01509 family)
MINTIIFDMDGVLIDSEPYFRQVEKELFEEIGIPFSDEEIDKYVGRTGKDFWENILSNHNVSSITVEQALYEHVERYINLLKKDNTIKLMDGVIGWVKELKKMNKNLIIASSSPRRIIDIVFDKFKLNNYFEHYISGDSVTKGKPNPEIFLTAAKVFGAIPESCLVIEDSENGVKAAKSAGMSCIAYKNDNSGNQSHDLADYIIKSYSKEEFEKVLLLINK